MSKVAIVGNAGGTGTVTVTSQSTSSNYTITLPNETGTLTTTASTPTFTGAVTAPSFIPNGSSAPTNGLYLPAANAVGIATNSTVALTIDSSQQVGIGTSSPGGKFEVVTNSTGLTGLAKFTNNATSGGDVNIAIFANQTATQGFIGVNTGSSVFNIGAQGASTPLVFYANGNERARITSGGYFKASNTGTYYNSTGAYHELRSDANNTVVRCTDSISSGFTDAIAQFSFTGYTPNNTTAVFLWCDDTTNVKAKIDSNGTFESRTSTYGGISDVKLKQDIVDANSQWNDIKNLRVRKFRFKDEVAVDPNYPAYIGLIAQEAELVSPGLVSDTPDMEEVEVTDEEGNVIKKRQATGSTTKFVKYSILYMKAVKALQEAMTRIEALEAEVAALKAKE